MWEWELGAALYADFQTTPIYAYWNYYGEDVDPAHDTTLVYPLPPHGFQVEPYSRELVEFVEDSVYIGPQPFILTVLPGRETAENDLQIWHIDDGSDRPIAVTAELLDGGDFLSTPVDTALSYLDFAVLHIVFAPEADSIYRDTAIVVFNDERIERIPIVGRRSLESVDERKAVLPSDYTILTNYPNPFNDRTIVSFNLARSGESRLSIVDPAGRIVQDLNIPPWLQVGCHNITWDASGLPSGAYMLRLQNGSTITTRNTVLIR